MPAFFLGKTEGAWVWKRGEMWGEKKKRGRRRSSELFVIYEIIMIIIIIICLRRKCTSKILKPKNNLQIILINEKKGNDSFNTKGGKNLNKAEST